MMIYEILIALPGYAGAKTGRVYHTTPGAVIEAPEGEFKNLKQGQYRLVGQKVVAAPAPQEETTE